MDNDLKYETIVFAILQNNFKLLYLLKKMTTPNFDIDETILRKLERTKYVYKLNIDAVFEDGNYNELEFNQSITKSQIAILQAIYGKKLNVEKLQSKLDETIKKFQDDKTIKNIVDSD